MPIIKSAGVLHSVSELKGGRLCDHAAARPFASGVSLRRFADAARPAGGRGVRDRAPSRQDADAADGDRGALSPSAHDQTGARHKIYPYLLRDMAVTRPNQVWAMDITYIPMARGFVYLAVVLDWFSRRVLSWRLSITMEATFCVLTATWSHPLPAREAYWFRASLHFSSGAKRSLIFVS